MIALAALLAGCATTRGTTLPAPQNILRDGSAQLRSERNVVSGAAKGKAATHTTCPAEGCLAGLAQGVSAGPGLSVRRQLTHQSVLALAGGQGPRKDALDVHVLLSVQYAF